MAKKKLQAWPILFLTICGFRKHQKFASNRKKIRECIIGTIQPRLSYQSWLNTPHIKNNWLGAIFFSPGDNHTRGLLALLHLSLEGVTEVDTDPKGRFVSLKVTPSNGRVLCVYAQGIAPGNSCLEGVSLKDYKIIWKIKWRKWKQNNTWRL